MSIFDPPRPGDDHWDEERNWRFEEERRRERERQHAPAHSSPEELAQRHPILAAVADMAGEPVWESPPVGPDPVLLMVVQVKDDITIGEVLRVVANQSVNNGVTLMLWDRRPRRRHRRAMRLLFGRKLGKWLTG